MFFEHREQFMAQLAHEIENTIIYAEKKGLIPVFRLNGTSDIAWEKIRITDYRNIFDMFDEVQFYDYTKIAGRTVPSNYHLTFSAADGNDADVVKAIDRGYNVAVVFADKKLPERYENTTVFNGDESDLRFLDPRNVIVGLYAKGKAKKDNTGFVKHIYNIVDIASVL